MSGPIPHIDVDTLMSALPDSVFIVDSRGIISRANPVAESTFGRSDLEGLELAELIAEPHRSQISNSVTPGTWGVAGLHPSREEFPLSLTVTSVGPDMLLAVLRNAPSSELERFFSVSLDMLCISHSDGYFKRLSPAFTEALGWSVEEMLARPYVDFVHPDEIEATVAEVQRQVVAGQQVLKFENSYRHKDGSWRILSWRSVPQEGGYMFAVARDVTEEKAMEAELRLAKEQAETASRAKSEFLSRMSHELRTPLNSVLGFAQLLDLQYDDPKIKEASHSILRGGKHLLEMINEVLDLSRIESGNLAISVEPVPVGGVISQALNLLHSIALGAEVGLEVDGDVCEDMHVQADRQRLLQVLVNLMTNAIKYNHPKGKVWVRCLERSENISRIEISDTGRGIDEADWDQLFVPFQRFGESGIEGTGLGLALSERFVKLMGGDIGLVSSTPEGSTFYIDLPRVEAAYHDVQIAPAADAEVGPSRAGTVLYIEDNLSNMRLLEIVLADWTNLTLIPAMQGLLGLELAREHRPDLILLDLHLPDVMGDEVLQRLKADPATAPIPVVIVSADATPRQIKSLESLGAAHYLTKPLDLTRLFEVLHEHLPEATTGPAKS